MNKKIICPNCDGSCKDEDGCNCEDCNGTGSVEISGTVKGMPDYVKRSKSITGSKC